MERHGVKGVEILSYFHRSSVPTTLVNAENLFKDDGDIIIDTCIHVLFIINSNNNISSLFTELTSLKVTLYQGFNYTVQ